MPKAKLLLLSFLLLSLSNESFAQLDERPDGEDLLWGRYWLRLKITEQIRVHEMFINHSYITGGLRQKKFVNHVYVEYRAKNDLYFTFGGTFSEQWRNKKGDTGSFVTPEFRIREEVGYRWNLADLRANSKIRVEQRFYHNHNGTELNQGFYYLGKVRVGQSFSKDLGSRYTATVGSSISFLIIPSTHSAAFEFVRNSASLTHHLNDTFSIAVEYMNNAKKISGYERLSLGNTVRFSLIHNLTHHGHQ